VRKIPTPMIEPSTMPVACKPPISRRREGVEPSLKPPC